jgi:5-formyltetrahydrofolate cyclo-ligase
VTSLDEAKRAARAGALAARAAAAAASPGADRQAAAHVLEAVAGLRGVATVAGYLPIRNEFDPRQAMLALAGLGFRLCVPVVEGPARPLAFRTWTPDVATERRHFGVEVPATGAPAVPDLLLVPMLAFDRRGHRLGYGGGFYDRTIAALRARGPLHALGLAYAAQEIAAVPDGETDMPLDAIATERGLLRFAA